MVNLDGVDICKNRSASKINYINLKNNLMHVYFCQIKIISMFMGGCSQNNMNKIMSQWAMIKFVKFSVLFTPGVN